MTVNYDSDGNRIENDTGSRRSSLQPVTACKFEIKPEMNGLNVTLIGGGAGGGISYYSGIDYRIQGESEQDIRTNRKGTNIYDFLFGEEDQNGNLDMLNAMGLDLTVEYDYCNGNVKIPFSSSDVEENASISKYFEDNLKDISKDKILCKNGNTNEYFVKYKSLNGESAKDEDCRDSQDPSNAYESRKVLAVNDNPPSWINDCTNNMYKNMYKVTLCSESFNSRADCQTRQIEEETNMTLSKLFTTFKPNPSVPDAFRICSYDPKYLYTSVSPAPAGNVEKFSILKSDLQNRENKFFTICHTPDCDGTIGKGGKINESGDATTFKYDVYLNNGQIEKKEYTTNISEAVNSGIVYLDDQKEDFNKPGKEPNTDALKDFDFSSFDLHSGYVKDTNAEKATLFGSSGAVYYDNNYNVCKGNYNDRYMNRLLNLGYTNICPLSNKVIKCDKSSLVISTVYDNLNGAPGAIIIEW